jgi:hypothetical protein
MRVRVGVDALKGENGREPFQGVSKPLSVTFTR